MNKNETFLQLLKAGLWGTSLDVSKFSAEIDWDGVYQLAQEQTVMGFVTEGISQLPREKQGRRQLMLQFYKQTAEIEDENRKMNEFVPYLISQMERMGVQAVLLKGQGVAANYMNPLRRAVGDIDLLITGDGQYERAKKLMEKIATLDEEDVKRKHVAFLYKGMVVELHGNFRFLINKKCKKHLDAWKRIRLTGDSRAINNDYVKGLVVPSIQFDVVFIFAHMLGHLMGSGGVGLRQVSDWMMFVNKYYDEIDLKALEEDLLLLGLWDYWRIFGAMAVSELGFPSERMPYYDSQLKNKGRKILKLILYTGNFGTRQKVKQLDENANVILKKMVTLLGQLPVYVNNFIVFPKDTVWCFGQYLRLALRGYQS